MGSDPGFMAVVGNAFGNKIREDRSLNKNIFWLLFHGVSNLDFHQGLPLTAPAK
jgi:hypothetical protein